MVQSDALSGLASTRLRLLWVSDVNAALRASDRHNTLLHSLDPFTPTPAPHLCRYSGGYLNKHITKAHC